jgi:hypothetical protein
VQKQLHGCLRVELLLQLQTVVLHSLPCPDAAPLLLPGRLPPSLLPSLKL